jgi:hypothetical protein
LDLNQLYFEHQSQRMKADAATSPECRVVHDRRALEVAERITRVQLGLGAAAAASWTARAAEAAAKG